MDLYLLYNSEMHSRALEQYVNKYMYFFKKDQCLCVCVLFVCIVSMYVLSGEKLHECVHACVYRWETARMYLSTQTGMCLCERLFKLGAHRQKVRGQFYKSITIVIPEIGCLTIYRRSVLPCPLNSKEWGERSSLCSLQSTFEVKVRYICNGFHKWQVFDSLLLLGFC